MAIDLQLGLHHFRWLWTTRSSGYCQAICPAAQQTCPPATYPSWFLCHFAQHWLRLCWSPVSPLNACVLLLLQSTFSFLDLQYQVDVCMVRCVLLLFALCLCGARCFVCIWGLEVPGHPVLGSLHSPSTWRKVSFGWFRFQGCHGYVPFPVRLLLPANLSGTSSQAHLFVMSLTALSRTSSPFPGLSSPGKHGWPFVSKLRQGIRGFFCRVYLFTYIMYGL